MGCSWVGGLIRGTARWERTWHIQNYTNRRIEEEKLIRDERRIIGLSRKLVMISSSVGRQPVAGPVLELMQAHENFTRLRSSRRSGRG